MKMEKVLYLLFGLTLCGLLFWKAAQPIPEPQTLDRPLPMNAYDPAVLKLLDGFTENKGQIKDQFGNPNTQVKYQYVQPGFNVHLRDDGFSYELLKEEWVKGKKQMAFHRIDIDFAGAQQPQIMAQEATGALKNFRKNLVEETGAITGVETFRKIVYQEIYPEIDLSFEIDSSGQMEYNFIVHEAGDPSVIQLSYQGTDELNIVNNKLQLATRFGLLEEVIPKSWYDNGDQMEEVEVEYLALNDHTISFIAPEGEGDLVIDPVPIIDFQIDFKADAVQAMSMYQGFFILTGRTDAISGFASTSAHQGYLGTGCNVPFLCSDEQDYDAYLYVFDSEGTRYWATYYGGGGPAFSTDSGDLSGGKYREEGWAIAIDGNAKIYLGGKTWSDNNIATANGYDNTYNGGYDGFLAKFDLVTGQREWGTYLGSTTGVKDLVVHGANLYVAALGRLFRFNSSGELIWEHTASATLNTIAYRDGGIYVAGKTSIADVSQGAGIHQANYGGGQDAYVARYNPNGLMEWASYYGGSGSDEFREIQTDGSGNLYLAGVTSSTAGIATSSTYQTSLQGAQDAMLVKMTNFGQRLWGTYFGGENQEWVGALVRQSDGSIVVGGSTDSKTGINSNPCNPQTSKPQDPRDAPNSFLASFSNSGNLEYGTYLPGGFTDPEIEEFCGIEDIIMYGGDMYLAFNEIEDGYFMKIREEELAPEFSLTFSNSTTVSENGQSIPAYNFGGNSSCYATQIFTIKNNGTGCLVLSGEPSPIQLSDETNFKLIQTVETNLLFQDEETTFEIMYTPASVGQHVADVVIPNTDPGESDYFLRLIGTTGDWNLEVSGNGNLIQNNDHTPSATDHTFLGTASCESISRDFIIKNTGASCLDVQNITINNSDFELSGITSQEVGPGASFSLTVTALPNFGDRTGSVTIVSNDLDEPIFKFDVSVAQEPGIQVLHNGVPIANGDQTPSSADGTDFGFYEFDDEVTQTFTIRNISSCTINLSDGGAQPELTFGSDTYRQWSFINVPTVNELAPNQSIDFTVKNTPVVAGYHDVEVKVYQGPAEDPAYVFKIAVTIELESPDPVLENCPDEVLVNATSPSPAVWTPPVAYEGGENKLQTGDLAFTNISINPDGSGSFSMVALDDIPANSELIFSNGNWVNTEGFVGVYPREAIFDLNKTVPKGTVLNLTSKTGVVGGGGYGFEDPAWGLADLSDGILLSAQDHLFAYIQDGTGDALTENDLRCVAGIDWSGGWDENATAVSGTSSLPDILQNTGNAIAIAGNMMSYDCNQTNGEALDISAAIHDPTNWTSHSNPISDYTCNFNLSSNYRIPITLTANFEPGDVFPLGTTTVNYTGTSMFGPTVTCSFEVELGPCFPASDATPGEIEWTGAIDKSWANVCNWNRGSLPLADDNVIIPEVATGNYPEITGDVTVKSITIQSGAIATVKEIGTLRIRSQENIGIGVNGVFVNKGTLYIDEINNYAIGVSNLGAQVALAGKTYIGSNVAVGAGLLVANDALLYVGGDINSTASDSTFLSINNLHTGDAFISFGGLINFDAPNGSTNIIEIGTEGSTGIAGSAINLNIADEGTLLALSAVLIIENTGSGKPAIDVGPNSTFNWKEQAIMNVSQVDLGIVNEGTFNNAGTCILYDINNEAISNTGTFNNFDGFLRIDGTFNGVTTLEGTLAPGVPIGEVVTNQDLDLSAASLEVEVDGSTPGEYDQLVIDGVLTLGGNLVPTFTYSTTQNDRIVFCEATSVVGTFNSPNLPTGWSIDYSVEGEVAFVHEIAPHAVCQDITIDADANCVATVVAEDLDGGSNDPNDASLSFSLDQIGPFPVGNTSVVLTVSNGNATASCDAIITVVDQTAPNAICQDITIQLDANRTATLNPIQIDNGSMDNCGNVDLSIIDGTTTYGCEDAGVSFQVILMATDQQQLSSTCTAAVRVADDAHPCNLTPIAVCQDITVVTDDNCQAIVLAEDIDGGSTDPDEDPLSFSIDIEGPLSVGSYPVVLTVSDGQLSSSCSANITVEDQTIPTAICQDVTLQLDASGLATTSVAAIDNGSTDACGLANLSLDQNNFDCDDVGTHTVTLAATDINGNSNTCTATVTVEDEVVPTAICQDVTVYLDPFGEATTTAEAINNGSSDGCGIANLTIGYYPFDCSSIGSNNSITLTVTDNHGNQSNCTSIVTVIDEVLPNAVCRDVVIQLDASGNATITPSMINNGSNDACGIDVNVLSIDQTDFDCSHVGDNTVTLSLADNNGNQNSCTATVTVEDVSTPTAICQDINIQLDATGTTSITAGDIDNGSSDNCGLATLALDITAFDCADIGTNTVNLMVSDPSGLESTCTATVTIADQVAPDVLCQDVTVQLGANGLATITVTAIDGGSSDACGLANLSLDESSFNCEDVGPNIITLTATDINGNSSDCTATVTVEDQVAPEALCKNISVQLDENGRATITPVLIDDGSTDACGIESLVLDQTSFSCNELGEHAVNLTVTDVNGNASNCEVVVTIEDNTVPTANCKDITLDLNADGVATILGADIDGGSTDNCGIASLTTAPNNFSRSEIGVNTVELTVVDASGNSTSCTATVTINPALIAFVWDDQDGDGKQDAEEPAVADAPVELIDHSTGAVLQEVLTNTMGEAIFSVGDIAVDQRVKLKFYEKTGHRFSLKDQGSNDFIDSDVSRSSGLTSTFTLEADGLTDKWDAGLWAPGSVQAYVWDDQDGDGKQDAGEPGLEGAKVDLLESDGRLIASTTTNDAGLADFSNVPADRLVKLKFYEPANLRFTLKDQGSNDNIDSDASRSNGMTGTFQASKGSQSFDSWDAGMLSTGVVKAYVWDDQDGDGKQDLEEPAIAEARVNLLESDGSLIETSQTDETGIATFENVPTDRAVKLQFFEKEDHRFTLKDQGNNDNIDSDASRSNGMTGTFQASTGSQTFEQWDAGLWAPGSVQAYVWDDQDGDGKQDAGEPGLEGAKVDLLESDGRLIASTTTNDAGLADFSNVPADRLVKLKFYEPANLRFTLKDQGSNDNIDSDASRSNGMTGTFQANKGSQSFDSWDAGMLSIGVVKAYVWDDQDGDGKQDLEEPAIAEARVDLLESDGSLIETSQTDETGIATFENVPTDRAVKLQFFEKEDHRFTLKDQGNNDNIDSDASRSNGMTGTFQASTGNQTFEQWDAGLWAPGQVQSFVWDDLDGDGKQDEGEPGIKGVEVHLLEADGVILQTGLTDDSGVVTFENVASNRPFKLQFIELPNFELTLKDKGNNDNIDSDASRSSGITGTFQASMGNQTFESWDAGLWSPGQVEAFVWDDLDGDGKQDADEPGLANAQVHLLESDGTLISTSSTNELGIASFTNVPADRSVKLQFFEPVDQRFTLKDKGNNDSIDSDASRSNGMTGTFQASQGAQLHTQMDGGLWSQGEVEAFVWNDLDGDGKQDEGEPGVEGVLVDLLESNNEVIVSTTTNLDGLAIFLDVPANRTLKLRFHTPTDYTLTSKDTGNNDFIDSDASLSNGLSGTFQATMGQELFSKWDAGLTEVATTAARTTSGDHPTQSTGLDPMGLPSAGLELTAFPNPFSDQVRIQFQVEEKALVQLEVFNLQGQRVKMLFKGQLDAGPYEQIWRGVADNAQLLDAGVYIVRLTTAKQMVSRKVTLAR